MRIFKPAIFQGSLNKKNYFEGWYFKHVSKSRKDTIAIIPGISLTNDEKHAFIQVLDGSKGKSFYFEYPIETFRWDKKKFSIWIADSNFSDQGIKINIDQLGVSLQGELSYEKSIKYPSKTLAPGIMGWYTFVPFMECYHGVLSVDHLIRGSLVMNDKRFNFNEGKGYIEKDWGRSFPECWIWLQSNSFQNENSSLFFSVAKIPWLGKFFMGFICFLYVNETFYQFSSYNKASLNHLSKENGLVKISLSRKDLILEIEAEFSQGGELKAPSLGNMNRRIKESIDSRVSYRFKNTDSTTIAEDSNGLAGLEIIEEIFTYFK